MTAEPAHAELALRQTEERYRALFGAMGEGFCLVELLYDAQGAPVNYRFLETNPAFELHSGLVGAAGKTILELVPEFEAQWFAAYDTVAKTGQPLKFESEFKSMAHWFDVSVTRADSAGRLAILFKDITVKKLAEEKLKASEERVRLATQAAELGLWEWVADGDQVTWVNERMFAIYGMPLDAEPLTSARFAAEIAHPDDAPAFQQAIATTLQSGERFHFEGRFYRLNDRQLRWIEFTGVPQLAGDGVAWRMVGTAADITERKLAHQAIADSEERFKSLFESIDEGFSVVDVVFDDAGQAVDYRFLQTNPAFTRQSGLTPVPGESVRAQVPDLEERWITMFGDVVRTGQAQRQMGDVTRLGRTFEVYANRIGGPGSTKAAIVFSDVTEKMQADRELRDMAAALSETDRQKNEFLATLAHELRNPLAPISNGLHLLQLSGDPTVAKTVDMMSRQVNQMVHLVNDLLDVARISTGKIELQKQRAELRTIVANAVETSMPVINAGQHRLQISLPPTAVWMEVDPVRIAQVIGNLLSNAAKYASEPGPIEVSARVLGDSVEVAVVDAGIGIPAESLGQVFDMFAQVTQGRGLAQGGLGIGLSLVRKLVELHGGTVVAESGGVGRGSTFTVTLPLGSGLAGATQAPTVPAPAHAPPSLRVLVVDDNQDAAESLGAVLEMFGHTTRLAHDGHQALQAAADFLPQVVFLDIGLPGLTGYEVAAALRKQPRLDKATLIALTGWGAEGDKAMAAAAGFDHHLVKPADIAVIERLMNNL